MSDAELIDLFRRACEAFGARVAAIPGDGWAHRTPCPDWDVRELVNHLVVEDLWAPPLLEGRTIAEVGDRFDGDQLGDDPKEIWDRAVAAAQEAVAGAQPLDRIVHLSFGDTPASEYVMQLAVDHAVHADDLAVAIGVDRRLDPDLVAAIAGWFDDREDLYRGAGVIGPAVTPTDADDPQSRLLARFGRA